MKLVLLRPAKVGNLSFKMGENDVPNWAVDSLMNAGVVATKETKATPKKAVATKVTPKRRGRITKKK